MGLDVMLRTEYKKGIGVTHRLKDEKENNICRRKIMANWQKYEAEWAKMRCPDHKGDSVAEHNKRIDVIHHVEGWHVVNNSEAK